MYVYIQSESHLWTTGFYDPKGEWHPDKDFERQEDAAERVAWLNGGISQDISEALNSGDGVFRP